jgi:ankyrin repeat protein
VFVRNGATALHVAAEEDHVEIVQLLLEHGAVVDERKEYDFAAQIQARGVLTVLCQ